MQIELVMWEVDCAGTCSPMGIGCTANPDRILHKMMHERTYCHQLGESHLG